MTSVILFIATRNRHKVEEIQSVLGSGVKCVGLESWTGVPEVVEDAPTFEGNSTKKALQFARWCQAHWSEVRQRFPNEPLWVLADDSGLEVDALNGAPGVHSARFAALDRPAHAGNSSDADNNAKLLKLLESVPAVRRTGRFRCVLAVVSVSSQNAALTPLCFQGACEGSIRATPAGGGGFGYDPLFIPDGHTLSFAELGSDIKNQLSHRARALQMLCSAQLWKT